VGQPLVSFTTPDWNTSRNSSQRTSQNGIASLRAVVAARRFDCDWYLSGATRMDMKPASNSNISLKEREKKRDRVFSYHVSPPTVKSPTFGQNS
jgi:hypothetical protein